MPTPPDDRTRPASETDALANLAARDLPAGIAGLFERVAPALYAWAAIKVRNRRLETDDLLSDIWLRAIESFEQFDRDRGSFRQWIFGIAANVLANTLRRYHLRREKGDGGALGSAVDRLPESVTAISQRAARQDDVRAILELVEEIAPEDRNLLVHFGLEGLPASEVGPLLQLTPDAAAKRWQRLRDKLRGRLTSLDLLTGDDQAG